MSCVEYQDTPLYGVLAGSRGLITDLTKTCPSFSTFVSGNAGDTKKLAGRKASMMRYILSREPKLLLRKALSIINI